MNFENEKNKKYFPITINEEKAKTHKLLNIKGIYLYFPYKPYQLQITYMEKVLSTLNSQGNISALENPTGTGKTLCLLCAILGWLHQTKNKISIYYCTRTVSQINNILKELKKTCYNLQLSFLASRVHTCLKFDKGKRIEIGNQKLNDYCKDLKNFCLYYTQEKKPELTDYNNIEDIEDLLKEGKDKKFCPYFYNLFKTKNCANLTFMTYNYLLNPKIRKKN